VTRVLIGAFSPMMQSIITAVLSHRPDVTLIEGGQVLTTDLENGQVDVVLTVASDPEDVQHMMELLWRWPRCRVVAVANSGRTAVVYELFPRKRVLGDLSPVTLVKAICG
jgi:DNA-binding transcriptional LysR family regulator